VLLPTAAPAYVAALALVAPVVLDEENMYLYLAVEPTLYAGVAPAVTIALDAMPAADELLDEYAPEIVGPVTVSAEYLYMLYTALQPEVKYPQDASPTMVIGLLALVETVPARLDDITVNVYVPPAPIATKVLPDAVMTAEYPPTLDTAVCVTTAPAPPGQVLIVTLIFAPAQHILYAPIPVPTMGGEAA